MPNQPEARIDFSTAGKEEGRGEESKKRLINDNPSRPGRDFTKGDTRFKSHIGKLSAYITDYSPGHGIYLQGPHLLGTVMVVSSRSLEKALSAFFLNCFGCDRLLI